VLRAAGETETAQGNIQDWLQLDEGDPGFQLLTGEEIAALIFFYLCIFISTPYRRDRIWGPPSLLFNAHRGLFPGR
jgi:hypothetical protein